MKLYGIILCKNIVLYAVAIMSSSDENSRIVREKVKKEDALAAIKGKQRETAKVVSTTVSKNEALNSMQKGIFTENLNNRF